MVEMELYSGLSWAVPKAFGSALHGCRFEQGDVLYQTAHEVFGKLAMTEGVLIVILNPAASSE